MGRREFLRSFRIAVAAGLLLGVSAPFAPAQADQPAPAGAAEPAPGRGRLALPLPRGPKAATAAEVQPAGAPGDVPPPAPVPAEVEAGPLDAALEKAQGPAPAADTGPVPPASEAAGPAPALPPGDLKSFVLSPDRIPLGKQGVGLTVDVVGPPVWNLNQPAALKVVVRNTGTTDALGVSVRDRLPDGLAFVSSQPEAQPVESLLTWALGSIPAGTEKTITLNVKPTRTGAFDHAATVTLMAGGKSRTIVREPKLKVEQAATTGKILKGQPAEFKIVISNPGDGPARHVTVQAKLSPGLRHESAPSEPNEQNLFEQTLDVIPPGERVVLDPLVADTLQGGDQTCEVVVHSPDVVAGGPDARVKTAVSVIEPKLEMTLGGPDKRYTDTLATYDLTLVNPGTAPARNVKAYATVPVSGRLYALPAGAKFDAQTRRLTWARPQLDPGEKAVMTFQVRMGGIGLYQVSAEARADSGLLAKKTVSTDVSGLAAVDIEVTEGRRAVDVGETTVYKIKIVNRGTKEATRVSVSAKIPETVKPVQISGTDEAGKFSGEPDRLFVFPLIERLGPGKQMELSIKVEAMSPGVASCRVFLTHDDLTEKLEDMAVFKVEKARR